jgi:type IV pilus assembly protein PilM
MANGIGITIGSRSLRAIEVRRKGPAWHVTRAVVVALDGADDAARVAEAEPALVAAGMKGTALAGLTGKDLIVRYTHAPRVPDWRLEMLMRFEIQEVAEQSGGDVAADWALLTLPAGAGEDDTVLVALARNAHLRPRLDAANAAGLRVLGACPRSIALYHAFVTNCKVPPGEVTLLLHLGGENTDVAIQRDGALLFARNMAGGGKPFTDAVAQAFRVAPETAEKMKVQKGNVSPRQKARYADSTEEKVANALLGTAGSVVAAVHSSLMFCKAQTKLQDLRIDRVLVSGDGARIRGMTEYLSSGLGVPVEKFDPFETVDTSGLDPEAAEALKESGPSMAAALGLAQMAADDKAFRLEILPEEDRRKRQFSEHTAWLIASGVVAAAGLVFLYVRASGEQAKASENEKALQTALDRAAKMRTQGEQKRKKVEAAVERLAVLRDEVALGPSLEAALGVTQAVLDSHQDFQAIHFPDVKARYLQIEVPDRFLPKPAEGEPQPGDAKEGGTKEAGKAEAPAKSQARVPAVTFVGSISQKEKAASIMGNFLGALKAAVEQRIPGGYFRESGGGLKGGRTFEIRIEFYEGWRPVGEK